MKTTQKLDERLNNELEILRKQAAELEKLKNDYKRLTDELREARHESEIRVKVRTAEVTKRNEDLHREVAERKRIEEILKDSELRYRTILDSMVDPIHVVDDKLRIVICNHALLQWNKQLGLVSDGLAVKTVFEVYPFLPDNVRAEYDKVFQTAKILLTEEATRLGDRAFITETRKIPVLEEGRVVKVITVIRDITERKETEEKFRAVINSTPDGFWIIDLGGKFLEVNPAICRLLDYSPQEMSKMEVSDIEAVESAYDVGQHIEKIKESGSDRFETKLGVKTESL